MGKSGFINARKGVFLAVTAAALYTTSFINYLLFHSIIEMYSIAIAFTVFMISWNSKEFNKNSYIVFLGTAYLFIGMMDFFHTLSYSGMNIFADYDFYASQFWVVGSLIESSTLFVVFARIGQKDFRASPELLFAIYLGIASIATLSILVFKVFPECYMEGVGHTPFKYGAEAVVMALLIAAFFRIRKNRHLIGDGAYPYLAWAVVLTLLSEIFFIIFIDKYGLANATAHFFKLCSFYMIYIVTVDIGLKKPQEVYFREFQKREDSLQESALVDLETGLLNRRAYERIKEKLWVIFKKRKTRVGIGLISINNFEELKESYGAHTLKKVLDGLVEITRDVLSDDHFFFRLDTNTFLILFGEDEERIIKDSEKIRKRFASDMESRHGIKTDMNYGISNYDSLVSYSLEDLYESANENLSRKKLRYLIRTME